MKEQISASDARADFLKLLRQIQENPMMEFEITNRDHVVAVIKSPEPMGIKYGAAKAMLDLQDQLPEPKTKKLRSIAANKNQVLYGRGGVIR